MTNLILHIGAGRGQSLDELVVQARAGARVVLVEANSENADELRNEVREEGAIEIHQCALSDANGQKVLNVFNLDECSSLREPTGLWAIFPGLKKVDTLSVKVRDAGTFVKELQVDGRASNTVIVKAPGEELAILTSLEKAGMLSLFSSFRIRCGEVEHYEGAGDAEAIEQFLAAHGFRSWRGDDDDPDFCNVIAERDQVLLEKQALEAEVATLKARVQSLEGELAAAEPDVTAEQLSAAETAKAEAQKTAEELTQRVRSLEADLGAEKQQQEKALEGFRTKVADQDARLKDAAHKSSLFQMNLRGAEAQLDLLKELMKRDAKEG